MNCVKFQLKLELCSKYHLIITVSICSFSHLFMFHTFSTKQFNRFLNRLNPGFLCRKSPVFSVMSSNVKNQSKQPKNPPHIISLLWFQPLGPLFMPSSSISFTHSLLILLILRFLKKDLLLHFMFKRNYSLDNLGLSSIYILQTTS